MSVSSQTVIRVPPQSGTAFLLRAGERLTVIDPLGEQVADLVAFRSDEPREVLSSGRTLDYAETIYLTTGHRLYSNASRPMFALEEDTVGRHDFLLTPCCAATFRILYGSANPHPGCFENLESALREFGIDPHSIPTTFNIFMNVEIRPDGTISVLPPRSRAGDRLVLRAEMDLIVGLTACSAELSNNYSFKPIDYRIDASSD
jgi:uncharacterized protein YcgI (DUF1989 family)